VTTIRGTANAVTISHVGGVASEGHCPRFDFREAEDFQVAWVHTLKIDGWVSCSLDMR